MTMDSDAILLAQLGYKQELKRAFRPHEVFGIGFAIIGLVPSIASVRPLPDIGDEALTMLTVPCWCLHCLTGALLR